MPPALPIDVIVACYNGERWLSAAMDSILAQTHGSASVTVVDDGSTDGSRELLAARYPAVHLEHTVRKGASGARNHGLRSTRSPYVIFMDQDDLWHPEHLELLAALAQDHPRAPLVATSSRDFPDGGRPVFQARRTTTELFDPWLTYPAHGFNCVPALSMFKRAPLERLGGCPEHHEPMSDYSLWMLLSMDDPIPCSHSCTVAHRTHRTSQTSRVTSDRLGYSEICLRVDKDLLDAYVGSPHVPADRRRQATARYATAVEFHEIARSRMADSPALESAIAEIDRRLSVEPVPYRRAFLRHFLTWMPFDPIHPTLVYASLLDLWPDTPVKTDVETVIVDRLASIPDLGRFLFSGKRFSPRRLHMTLRTLSLRTIAHVHRRLTPGLRRGN